MDARAHSSLWAACGQSGAMSKFFRGAVSSSDSSSSESTDEEIVAPAKHRLVFFQVRRVRWFVKLRIWFAHNIYSWLSGHSSTNSSCGFKYTDCMPYKLENQVALEFIGGLWITSNLEASIKPQRYSNFCCYDTLVVTVVGFQTLVVT